MEIFAEIVHYNRPSAQPVPVGFSMTGTKVYGKMAIHVLQQGNPPMDWDTLGYLLGLRWPLYSMPQYNEHPFWFNVTDDAGVFFTITQDRMPATRTVISAGNIEIDGSSYKNDPLDPGDVQSVLDQAIHAWSRHPETPVPERVH